MPLQRLADGWLGRLIDRFLDWLEKKRPVDAKLRKE